MYKNFKHQYSIQLRFSDLDPLNHVNNANYLTYIEQARVAYFTEVSQTSMSLAEEGVILAKATVDFKQPIYLQDEILIFTRCNRLGNKSFDLEYELVKVIKGVYEIAATASTVMVSINYGTGRPIPIPDSWRQRVIDFEGKENIAGA